MNKALARLMGVTERDVQLAIVEMLEIHGCEVLQTNLAKARVIADKGVPDLIVTHPKWPASCWLGMEVKKPGGKCSPAQADLEARGRIVVVDNVDDAYEACKAFVREMTMWTDGYSSPRRSISRVDLTLISQRLAAVAARCDTAEGAVMVLSCQLENELNQIGVDVVRAKPRG